MPFSTRCFCQTGFAVPESRRRRAAMAAYTRRGAARSPSRSALLTPPARNTVEVGLPWGTKPRLILAHLNAEALRQQSPVIEVESSLSAFVKRIRGFQHGREIRAFKDQLSRLSVAAVRLANVHAATGHFRSTPRSSPPSSCGPSWTRGSACYGPRRSSYPLSTSTACKSTPCRSTRPTLPRSPTPPWASTSIAGWRSGCTGSTRPGPPSSSGPRSSSNSAPTTGGWSNFKQIFRVRSAPSSGPLQGRADRARRLRHAAPQQPAAGHQAAGLPAPLVATPVRKSLG